MPRLERIDGRRRLVVDQAIDAPAEAVWDVLIDTDRWPEWGPSVSSVETDDRRIQRGTTGRIKTPVGIRVPFEITGCDPYRWTWRVARIPATGHSVDQVSERRCRLAFDMPLSTVGYAPVCRRALDKIARIAEA